MTFRSPALHLAALIWAGGMLGFVAIITLHFPKTLPALLDGHNTGIPISTLLWIATAQSAVLLAVATWAGVKTAPAVGLRAPVLEAMATRQAAKPALMPQLGPGLGFGLLCGIFLYAANALGPDAWVQAQSGYYPSLLPRLLFGGITEEVLLRWGLMSTIVWLLTRMSGAGGQPAPPRHLWTGVIATAVLFGVAHLPAVANAVGGLDATLALYIVGANAVAGTLFGWLYWRHGLEAAIIAHATAHLVNYLVGLV